MRGSPLLAVCLAIVILLSGLLAATPGIFVGRIYCPPEVRLEPGWLFVQGRKGMLRKVEISGAEVVYSKAIPRSQRMKDPSKSLTHGVEVQVTAEQDGQGEWRARQIEILRLPPSQGYGTDARAERN
jgi:hypothetical protein